MLNELIPALSSASMEMADSWLHSAVVWGLRMSETRSLFSEIQRTFYNVSSRYIALVDEVPDELLELTSDVIDMSTGLLSYEVSPNLPFILADHIAYAVKRKEQNIVVRMPLSFDVRQQYPVEFRIGEYALKIIRNVLTLGFQLMRQLELPWRLSITWPIRTHAK